MEKRAIYHGSSAIVMNPAPERGKDYNDFGRGFYCTEHLELAKEWACRERREGYVSRYEINLGGLSVMDLLSEEYTVLHWVALLAKYRKFRVSVPVMKRGLEWLETNFSLDMEAVDIITGCCADDSSLSFVRAFLNNEVSLAGLTRAVRSGELKEQFVLKSEKAFGALRFVSYETADGIEYYAKCKNRDEKIRKLFLKKGKRVPELYIREMIREEVKADDPRLR